MSFLHPILFSAAACAISIPIIVHLLMRRRRKPMEWAAMRFLQEALRRTRRRRLIEKWVLLAARCLVIALIAVALGRPLLGTAATSVVAGRTIYIVFDNSIASAVVVDGKPAIENHKAAARLLLESLGPADRAGLVLLAGPSEGRVIPASTSLAAIRDLIDSASPLDSAADFAGALALLAPALSTGTGESVVAAFSDFRSGSADPQQALPRLPSSVRIVATIPAVNPLTNVGIARVQPSRQVVLPRETAETQTATVQLERSGPADAAQPVNIRVQLLGPGGAVLAAGTGQGRFGPGERSVSLTAALEAAAGATPAGGAVLAVQIDADALSRDDVWRLPIETRETLRVGIVADGSWRPSAGADALRPAQWLGLALRPSEGGAIELTDLEPGSIDAARLAGLDAAIVVSPERLDDQAWRRLGAMARAGGLVVVFPSPGATVQPWIDAMASGLGTQWNLSRETTQPSAPTEPWRIAAALPPATPPHDDLLGQVRGELPDLARPVAVSRLLPARPDGENGRVLLALENGSPLLITGRPRSAPAAAGAAERDEPDTAPRGLIALFTVALDPAWTDLPAKPLIVPLLQEVVRQGVGSARPAMWVRAGAPVRTPAQTAELRPFAPGLPTLQVGETGLTAQPVRTAGVWVADDAQGGARGLVAVNPDARGARTDVQDRAAIAAWLGAASDAGPANITWLDPARSAGAAVAEAMSPRGAGAAAGPLLLALAAVIALIETALARWSSHARGETGERQSGAARA